MNKKLVSFGNFLLKNYSVKVYSTDGTNVPLYGRLVSDADIVNWEYENPDLCRTLPSGHQIGEEVVLQFGDSGTVSNCRVIKVHFTEHKVLYDIEVTSYPYAQLYPIEADDSSRWSTRLYNVDSVFVAKPIS